MDRVGCLDQDRLTQYLSALMAVLAPVVARSLDNTTASAAQQAKRGEQALQHTGTAQDLARGEGATETPDRLMKDGDSLAPFTQQVLDDGRIVKHFEDGTIRTENPRTGIIQEERGDGKLLISLPGGRLLFQEFSGEPLLVYDLNGLEQPPRLARVGNARLPGQESSSLVFSFDDEQGTHIVEAESLRYFKTRPRIEVAA